MREPQNTKPIRQIAVMELPTRWGVFWALGFERWPQGQRSPETALVLVLGDPSRQALLVRIHAQRITGEVLRSLRCDCGEQLELAMGAIAVEGGGLPIHEQQEGQGIGLLAKLQADALQDEGLDTIAANYALGSEAYCGDFSLPAAVLKYLGVPAIRLLSDNPDNCGALAKAGIAVVERIPCEALPSSYSMGIWKPRNTEWATRSHC